MKEELKREFEERIKARANMKPDPTPSLEPNDPITKSTQPTTTVEELELKSPIRELDEPAKSKSETTISESTGNKVSYDNYHLVLFVEELDKVIERIKATKEVSIDLETTSTNPMVAQIVGIALSPAPHEAYYVPVGHKSAAPDSMKQLESEYVLQQLRPIIESEQISKIGQNLKYEFTILERYGIKLCGISHDTMIAAHFLDSSRRRYNLDELAMHYLEHQKITYKDVTGTGRDKRNFEDVELEKAKTYACEDADVAMILSKKLALQLEELNLIGVFKDIELKFIEILARIEINGVKVDSNLLESMSVEFEKELEGIAKDIYYEAGSEFNLNSSIQLGEILFDKLKLPKKKLTKTGKASTDDEVLEELSKLNHVAARVQAHRQISKLKSTYVDALPKLINPNTGRIHTSLRQTGTSTGRLSSSEPNLQNIPVKSPDGKRIREAFIPEDGFILLSADYSQIELRLLAHFSEDDNLVSAFVAGSDIHSRTAAEIFSVSEGSVTPEMRRLAKTINFGIIYGIGPIGLAKQTGKSSTDAKSYIDKYFRRYGKVKSYQQKSIREAERLGYAVTLLGRRRPIPELKGRATRGIAERTAINTPIQGSAADIIKIAMIRIHDQLKGLKSRMILQVHDELLFEIHESEKDEMSRMIKKEMEGAWKLKVPLRVDIGMGKNWAEAH